MTTGPARLVLDYIAFWELWQSRRPQFASSDAFYVAMLGYMWGREEAARRYAARNRWFHQDHGDPEHLRVRRYR